MCGAQKHSVLWTTSHGFLIALGTCLQPRFNLGCFAAGEERSSTYNLLSFTRSELLVVVRMRLRASLIPCPCTATSLSRVRKQELRCSCGEGSYCGRECSHRASQQGRRAVCLWRDMRMVLKEALTVPAHAITSVQENLDCCTK